MAFKKEVVTFHSLKDEWVLVKDAWKYTSLEEAVYYPEDDKYYLVSGYNDNVKKVYLIEATLVRRSSVKYKGIVFELTENSKGKMIECPTFDFINKFAICMPMKTADWIVYAKEEIANHVPMLYFSQGV